MLRDINAAPDTNKASHQMSQDALRVPKMPAKQNLLSELSAGQQPVSDMRTTGIDTRGQRPLDNFQINTLA